MKGRRENNISNLKQRLRKYSRQDIRFNEPHFSERLSLREGDKEQVITNLLKPEKLVYSYSEKGKYGDTVYCLHFKISNTKTLRLPVIFDRKDKKELYILTYIMRYRNWRNMIIR